jgi:hypothetical protein
MRFGSHSAPRRPGLHDKVVVVAYTERDDHRCAHHAPRLPASDARFVVLVPSHRACHRHARDCAPARDETARSNLVVCMCRDGVIAPETLRRFAGRARKQVLGLDRQRAKPERVSPREQVGRPPGDSVGTPSQSAINVTFSVPVRIAISSIASAHFCQTSPSPAFDASVCSSPRSPYPVQTLSPRSRRLVITSNWRRERPPGRAAAKSNLPSAQSCVSRATCHGSHPAMLARAAGST